MTPEEKYAWLLSQIDIVDIDHYEQDGFICMPNKIYFQFTNGFLQEDKDAAVEHAVNDWYRSRDLRSYERHTQQDKE